MPSRYTLPIVLFSVLLAIVPARAGADTIHFKNGSVLNNVIVMSQDWRGVQVRISDAVSMSFTRKDLDRIERTRMSTDSPPLRRPPSGVRVPSALQAKLTESIAVNYPEPTSFVEIFGNISKLYGVNITVDAKVKQGIASGSIDPRWTFTKTDGSNVFQMLAKLEEDKALTWQFSDDTILIGVSSQPVPAVAPMRPTVPGPALGFPTVPVIPTPATAPGAQFSAPPARGVPGAPARRQRGGGRPARGPGAGRMGRRGKP
jgi:hypothetical protein